MVTVQGFRLYGFNGPENHTCICVGLTILIVVRPVVYGFYGNDDKNRLIFEINGHIVMPWHDRGIRAL